MKKRIVAILCVFVLLAGILAGCGGKEAAPDIRTPDISSINPGKTQAPTEAASGGSFWDQVEDSDYYTVYVQAYSGWGTPRLWAWSEEIGDLYQEWPGQEMHIDASGWYSMTISKDYDYVLVNGQDGNVQTEDEYTGGEDIWFTIEDGIYYVDSSKPSGTAAAPAPAAPANDNYIAELSGNWETVHLQEGSMSLQVAAMVFDQTVYNCTQMTISMQVEMNAGTSCKDWQVWGRSGSSFVKLDKMYLAAGNGYTSATLNFSTPVTFDAIAITPTVPGGYSWSLGFIVTDVYTK